MMYKIFFNKNLKKSLLLFFFVFFNQEVFSHQDPVNMLNTTTHNVISALKKNENIFKDENKKNLHKEIYNIINAFIIPNVDLQEMTRWIMGKNTWQSSTKEEKNNFTIAFKELLIKNYYVTLNDYKEHEMQFLPIKDLSWKKDC